MFFITNFISFEAKSYPPIVHTTTNMFMRTDKYCFYEQPDIMPEIIRTLHMVTIMEQGSRFVGLSDIEEGAPAFDGTSYDCNAWSEYCNL